MSDVKIATRIKDRILRMYEQILARPYMFCHPIQIETFVMGIEFLLDELDPERLDRYRTYLGEKGFGMVRFENWFERENHCQITMAPRADDSNNTCDDLCTQYEQMFKNHWKFFLEWKYSNPKQPST